MVNGSVDTSGAVAVTRVAIAIEGDEARVEDRAVQVEGPTVRRCWITRGTNDDNRGR